MQKEGSKGSLRGKFKRAGWDYTGYWRCFEMRLPCPFKANAFKLLYVEKDSTGEMIQIGA
jgi:hypothetical protein